MMCFYHKMKEMLSKMVYFYNFKNNFDWNDVFYHKMKDILTKKYINCCVLS